MNYIIEETTKKLFEEVKKSKRENDSVSDDLMSALNCVFGQPLLSAFDLVDRNSVTKLTTPNRRELFKISGSSGKTYYCPSSLQFCPCPSFAFGVIKRGDLIMCKHILAVHLSIALQCCLEEKIAEKNFDTFLYEQ
uniref:zinc finger SWIM domain-containing protein 7-like isoform X1 n=1 Tax=Styela clava TaxID=7725 RepID=UPI0019398F8F|nr:zinc finger SWIM domain-containing protein 7-like isoform X1 [Styela clava]